VLTDEMILAAQPAHRAYKLTDSRGLYVFVTPKGAKSFRFKYRQSGVQKRMTFGLHPGVSLSDARQLRDPARRAISSGLDPHLGVAFAESASIAQLTSLAFAAGQPYRVYFAQRADGLIKIGVARDVFARMSALQRTDGPLSLLGSMAGSYAVENAIHHMFASQRAAGEWFCPTERLLHFVEDQIDRRGG
jgi:hypothetical protein